MHSMPCLALANRLGPGRAHSESRRSAVAGEAPAGGLRSSATSPASSAARQRRWEFREGLGGRQRGAVRCVQEKGSSPQGSDAAAVGNMLFPDASLISEALDVVPPLNECHHFINLTNGIEALPALHSAHLGYSFCRIQSTACEQQKFDQMMNEIDANLLIQLAAGRCCLVWDFGSRNRKRGVPRAIWYGLEFARYALNKEWLGLETDAYLRGVKVTKQFSQEVKGFSRSTKRRLRYFRRYIPADMGQVRLYGVYRSTEHDDDVEFYQEIFHSHSHSSLQDDGPGGNEHLAGAKDSQKALQDLGYRIFLGGICHKDLQSLLKENPIGDGSTEA